MNAIERLRQYITKASFNVDADRHSALHCLDELDRLTRSPTAFGKGYETTDGLQARMIAAATTHRACCGTEHDPLNGRLHGYCVVCGVDWPCETAKFFMVSELSAPVHSDL